MGSSRWAAAIRRRAWDGTGATFDIPESDQGRRIWVEFDGAFRDVIIFVNGCFIGRNDNGYAPFRFDLTDFLTYGKKNYIVARVDASFGDGWFYEGAGIYRHVWLTKMDALHLGKWESYVRSEVSGNAATLTLGDGGRRTRESKAESAKVKWQIVDAAGKTVATAEAPAQQVSADGSATFTATAKLANAALWSVETPNLYQAIVTVESGGKTRDARARELWRAHGEVHGGQGIFPQWQASEDSGHLQSPGSCGRWRGAAGCAAVVPAGGAAGDGRQCGAHFAQYADAGVGGGVRSHGHDDDVRDAADEFESRGDGAA